MYEICIEMCGQVVRGAQYATFDEALEQKHVLDEVYARNNFGAKAFVRPVETSS